MPEAGRPATVGGLADQDRARDQQHRQGGIAEFGVVDLAPRQNADERAGDHRGNSQWENRERVRRKGAGLQMSRTAKASGESYIRWGYFMIRARI